MYVSSFVAGPLKTEVNAVGILSYNVFYEASVRVAYIIIPLKQVYIYMCITNMETYYCYNVHNVRF